MSLQYLSLKIPKPQEPSALMEQVEQALLPHGQPIRWAITAVTSAEVMVEAVVQPQTQVSPRLL